MPTEKPRLMVTLTEEERKKVTDFQHEMRLPSVSKALVELIGRGIDVIEAGDREDRRAEIAALTGAEIGQDEAKLLTGYRRLDQHGRQAVQAVMEVESKRCQEEARMKSDRSRPVLRLVKMPVYDDPAAAGEPLSAESGYEYVEFKAEDVPGGAEFGVRISGASMGDTVPDGCVAFVRRAERASDGDVVIATLRGEGTVCKRLVADGDRLLRLHSDNPDYPDITGDRLDDLRIQGVVVGHT